MPSVRPKRRPALIVLLLAALVACGGSPSRTATPAASATPISGTAQAIPAIATGNPTPPATPTPLANNGTARATETGLATSAATSAATPTPLARGNGILTPTSGASVVRTSATTASASTTARSTTASGSVTASASGTSAAGSAAAGASAVGTPGTRTTTPVPAAEARGSVEQFLRTTLAKGDISGYLTPALKVQVGTDGYKVLNIQPPVREFTVDSEQDEPDGNGATVGTTITTAAGVQKRTFVMRRQGNAWLVDNVLA